MPRPWIFSDSPESPEGSFSGFTTQSPGEQLSEFRFPNQLAAEIAVKTVKDYLKGHPNCNVQQVVFNVFKDVDREIYQNLVSSAS